VILEDIGGVEEFKNNLHKMILYALDLSGKYVKLVLISSVGALFYGLL